MDAMSIYLLIDAFTILLHKKLSEHYSDCIIADKKDYSINTIIIDEYIEIWIDAGATLHDTELAIYKDHQAESPTYIKSLVVSLANPEFDITSLVADLNIHLMNTSYLMARGRIADAN